MKKPELLAPAGNMESFFAAIENGADAVYLGLKSFSARAKAENFTIDQLSQMVSYSHTRNKHIYITLNTLIKEHELPNLIELLSELDSLKIDGLIVQDMSLVKLVRDNFPNLDLHASTQMTVHNSAGVKILEELGFKRVVLARELTLKEITEIRKQTSVELEHFVHGAHCFSFSGQCYFSSWIGGKSGNRGQCTQPCRRSYTHKNKSGYYFSPKDLSSIDLLDNLKKAGVSSFKIEGRKKSAAYVAKVVSIYRKVLDIDSPNSQKVIKVQKEQLKLAFGRNTSSGFLKTAKPHDLVVPESEGATGIVIGTIKSVKKNRIEFLTKTALHIGDRVRVQPQNGQGGKAFTLLEIFQSRKRKNEVKSNSLIEISSPFNDRYHKGETIKMVASHNSYTKSIESCNRELKKSSPPPYPIHLKIDMPSETTLALSVKDSKLELRKSYEVESFVAEKRPLSKKILFNVFKKGGVKNLKLLSLNTGNLHPVVIPPSQLKQIRRDFYTNLRYEVDIVNNARKLEKKRKALGSILTKSDNSQKQLDITITFDDFKDIDCFKNSKTNRFIYSINSTLIKTLSSHNTIKPSSHNIVWDIPLIIFDSQWNEINQIITILYTNGWRSFRLNNISHFEFFRSLTESKIVAGQSLFSYNSQAIKIWKELGCSEITLHFEDDKKNIMELISQDSRIDKSLIVYSSIPLMTTRAPMGHVGSNSLITAPSGEQYQTKSNNGVSTLIPTQDFSIIGEIDSSLFEKFNNLIIDAQHLVPFVEKTKLLINSALKNKKIKDTHSFF
jgi:U32 family peptidase